MLQFFLGVCLAICGMVLMCLYRVVGGPGVIDRIIAINVVGTKTITVVLMMGFIFQRADFFTDIALVYAAINFLGSLAMAKYFERRGVAAEEGS